MIVASTATPFMSGMSSLLSKATRPEHPTHSPREARAVGPLRTAGAAGLSLAPTKIGLMECEWSWLRTLWRPRVVISCGAGSRQAGGVVS